MISFINDLFSHIDIFKNIVLTESDSIEKSKTKACIIAHLLQYADPLFTWDYATIQTLNVRFLTNSKVYY
jgi:hypothetical protein